MDFRNNSCWIQASIIIIYKSLSGKPSRSDLKRGFLHLLGAFILKLASTEPVLILNHEQVAHQSKTLLRATQRGGEAALHATLGRK